MDKNKFKNILVAFVGIIVITLVTADLFLDEEYRTTENAQTSCPTGIFTKSAMIFDSLQICATRLVPDEKLKYAANVAAEWLDNDGDGDADESRIINSLQESRSLVVMSLDGFSSLAFLKIAAASVISGYTIQDLSAEETNNPTRRDASQEEIHHIIVVGGWIKTLPKIFSDQKSDGSDLYNIWRFADDNGHYSYDDPTCDDSCKTVEFFYLATAAYLGSMADLFSDEMRLKDRLAMKQHIPGIMHIFESSDYSYPTNHWPTGVYAHKKNIRLSGIHSD